MTDGYMPLESLYSVIPILAEICQDGTPEAGSKNDAIDRLLLERNLDIINQVVQARQARVTSEKRRISKWVWALLLLLALSSLGGVILIQGGSSVVNSLFCVVTVVVMTSAFMVLADMEQPFGGFVQIDVSSFHIIRKDIRVVLRAAHLDQLQQAQEEGQTLSTAQEEILKDHKRMEARGRSVAKLDTEAAISNAELRLMAQPVVSAGRALTRKSMASLFRRAPSGDVEKGDGGASFVALFATMAADDGACSKSLVQLLPWLAQQHLESCKCSTMALVPVRTLFNPAFDLWQILAPLAPC